MTSEKMEKERMEKRREEEEEGKKKVTQMEANLRFVRIPISLAFLSFIRSRLSSLGSDSRPINPKTLPACNYRGTPFCFS